MPNVTGRRFASFIVLWLLGLASISGLILVQPSSASSGSNVASFSSATTLAGGELWLNNSYPFQSEAASSTILALPSLSTWLATHNISIEQLRPYDTLWSPQSNPYDYPQGTVGFGDNGTVYDVYTYILPNTTVIGVWVSEEIPTFVASIYTFPSQPSLTYGGYTTKDDVAVGHEASSSSTNPFGAAEYNTTVFSDLTSPSNCGTYCWVWGNWLGTSNYYWGGSVGSNPFFFQVILNYWGANQGKNPDCGSNSYTSNCVFFEYALDTTTLSAYTPNVGDWTAGDSVTMQWVTPSANCSPAGGVSEPEDWTVVLKITNDATSQYAQHPECFPDNY